MIPMNKSTKFPNGWTTLRLSEIGSFSKGKGIMRANVISEGIPCVRYGEIYTSHHNVINKFTSFIGKDTAEYSKKLKFNDLLFAGSGETREEIGKVVAYRLKQNAYAGGDIIILSVPDEHRADYIAYFLNTVGRKQLTRLGEGNAIVHIYGKDLEQIKVALPDKKIQDKVVSFLQTWDAAIEKTEALVAAKEQQFEWLCQCFFSPHSNITSSWKPQKIGNFVKQRKEMSPPTNEIPLYSLTIESGITAKTARYNREFLVKDKHNKAYKVAHPNDIVFNPANLRWGAIAVSEVPHRVVLSPIYEVYQILDGKINSDFLKYALTCKRQINIFATKTEGTLIERMAVKSDVFESCEIIVPPNKSEQKRIASTLNAARREAGLLKRLAEQYRTQKHGLMKNLLTGRWKTKEAANG